MSPSLKIITALESPTLTAGKSVYVFSYDNVVVELTEIFIIEEFFEYRNERFLDHDQSRNELFFGPALSIFWPIIDLSGPVG